MKKIILAALLVTMTTQPFFSCITKETITKTAVGICAILGFYNQAYVIYKEQQFNISTHELLLCKESAKTYYGLAVVLFGSLLIQKKSESKKDFPKP